VLQVFNTEVVITMTSIAIAPDL